MGLPGPESKLVSKILDEYRKRGAFAEKINGNAMQPRIVDILACYHGWFIAIECKAGNGKLTAYQAHVLQDVDRAGGIAEVCRSLEEALGILESIDNQLDDVNPSYA